MSYFASCYPAFGVDLGSSLHMNWLEGHAVEAAVGVGGVVVACSHMVDSVEEIDFCVDLRLILEEDNWMLLWYWVASAQL